MSAVFFFFKPPLIIYLRAARCLHLDQEATGSAGRLLVCACFSTVSFKSFTFGTNTLILPFASAFWLGVSLQSDVHLVFFFF